MPSEREIRVSLLPALLPPRGLAGHVAVVADILRATTTMVHALVAGATSVIPCGDIEEARATAKSLSGKVLLTGERDGRKVQGFDLGNSPAEFTSAAVKGAMIVMSTTNGTPALRAALSADRILVGAFVNFSAVCEQLDADPRPVHIVCAGTDGEPSLEDTIFAGALVDHLSSGWDVRLNDAARLAWDAFENHGRILDGAFEVSRGGEKLLDIGLAADLKAAAAVDHFAVVAEVRRDPVRVELSGAGIKRRYGPPQGI